MLSNDSANNSANNSVNNSANNHTEPQAREDVAPMNPRSHVEVASTGDGTITDPSAKDTRPPFTPDDDLSFLA